MGWLIALFILAAIIAIAILYYGPWAMKRYLREEPNPVQTPSKLVASASDFLKRILGDLKADPMAQVFNAVKEKFNLDNISELTDKELDDLRKLSDDELGTMGFREVDIKRLKETFKVS